MTTVLDLINMALLDSGIIGQGQTASAEDVNNAYTRMQWMVQQWQRKRYLVYHLVNLIFTSTGSATYTVGPGGDFNIGTRPDRLENGNFFRQLVQSSPNQIDYPLELLESFEDYNRIALKQLETFPGYCFYDPTYPLGTLYVWPVPQPSIYAINILVKATLIDLITGNDGTSTVLDATLPNEYFQAIYLSLAEILRTAYRLPVDPILVARAKESREVLRNAAAAIARLRMPDDLIRPGVYNPYSDQIT